MSVPGLAGVHVEGEIDPKHFVWSGPLLPTPDFRPRIETEVSATGPTTSSSLLFE